MNHSQKLYKSLKLVYQLTITYEEKYILHFTSVTLRDILCLKQNKTVEHIHNNLMGPCEKCKMVSFASSLMKNIFEFPGRFKFPAELIFCIAF